MVMTMKTPATNIRLCERKIIGRNEILNIISMNECHLYIYIFTEYKIFIKLVSKSSLYKLVSKSSLYIYYIYIHTCISHIHIYTSHQ